VQHILEKLLPFLAQMENRSSERFLVKPESITSWQVLEQQEQQQEQLV